MNRPRAMCAFAASLCLISGLAMLSEPSPALAQKPVKPDSQCVLRLRALHVGVMAYAKAHGGTLPKMSTPKDVQKMLKPYVKDPAAFVCPVLNTPFSPNAQIGGTKLSSHKVQNIIPLLYDTKKHPDGRMSIVYLNGNLYRGFKGG